MIVIAATPIGNLGDASPRLVEAFETASIVAAEDTRNTAQLMKLLGVQNKPELVSLHEHNERARAESLASRAETELVLLVSDAGMPTVSDPGFALVRAAVAAGVEVTVIPGPSAVLAALAVSGLPTDRFCFEGFLPRKAGELKDTLQKLAAEHRTMVFFESANRLHASLKMMAEQFGAEREATVSRELTKKFEQTRRGSLAELANWASEGVRGEIVIVVSGAREQKADVDDAVKLVNHAVESGTRLKDATRDVAALTGLSARDLYEAVITQKH